MSIPFTQYLLPNGRPVSNSIDMPEDVEKKAAALIQAGYHFDIEVLTTGLVSMTCEDEEDVISIAICENGPPVVDSVRKIVEDAAHKKLKNYKET
jgi:hypothetical protein